MSIARFWQYGNAIVQCTQFSLFPLTTGGSILGILADRQADTPVDAQAVMALAFFVGLRPGEIQGLRWEDLTDGWVHVRRAVVRSIDGETKTSGSVAALLRTLARENC